MSVIENLGKMFFRQRGITALSYFIFIFSINVAAITSIWAVYLYGYFQSDFKVGLFSSLLTLVSLISYFVLVPIIQQNNRKKLMIYTLILTTINYFLFGLINNGYVVMILAITITILYALRNSIFGILLKENSKRKEISKQESRIFSFLNMGWLIGPLIAAFIVSNSGFNHLFIITGFIAIISLISFYFAKLKKEEINEEKINILKNTFDFFTDKERTRSYLLTGFITSWWILIYLFMPLRLYDLGHSPKFIAIFLFVIALPLIAFEYVISKRIDKNHFKRFFLIGSPIVFLFTIVCFFITDIYLIILMLFLASIGMALLEPTCEAYFLGITRKKDVTKYFGPYITSKDLSQFFAKIIPTFIIGFLPFKFVFLFFSLYMLLVFILAFKIRRVEKI